MMVMAGERLIQDEGFLRPSKWAHGDELENKLLQLREPQYIIRYDRYMKIVPHKAQAAC